MNFFQNILNNLKPKTPTFPALNSTTQPNFNAANFNQGLQSIKPQQNIPNLNTPSSNISVPNQSQQYQQSNQPQNPTQVNQSITQQFPQQNIQQNQTAQNPFFNQINQLQQYAQQNPGALSFLGIGRTPAEEEYFKQNQEILPRLLTLQQQLAQANAPTEDQAKVQAQILELQGKLAPLGGTENNNAQTNALTFYQGNPNIKDVGITQGGLERTVGAERLPLEAQLSQLLMQKSALGTLQQQKIQGLQAQTQGLQAQQAIQQQLAQLGSQGQRLPESVSNAFLQRQFVPQITPHLENTGAGIQNIRTDQFGNIVGEPQFVAPSPINAFNYFQQNPQGATGVLNAIQSGNLNPGAINSRNIGFYGALYQADPNFNSVAANAAANFYQSTGTQEKLAWAKSVNENLGIVESLSSQVPRSDFPLLNKAIIAGKIQGGNPATVSFVNAANRTAAELSRVLGDTGGSDFRTRLASALLDPNLSKQQLSAAIATERQMIASLTNAFNQIGGQGNQSNVQFKQNADGSYTRVQ